jgi:hypothetical protein
MSPQSGARAGLRKVCLTPGIGIAAAPPSSAATST